jgi:plastocyanin
MRMTWYPGVVAVLLAACPAMVHAQQATGAITGTVTTTATARPALRITADTAACGRELPNESVLVGAGGALANVVVMLSGVKADGTAPEVVIVNEGCRFVPRVQVARPGQSVRTLSRDAVLHTTTAHEDGGRQLFNVALPVPGLTLARPVGGAGLVRVVCQMHPWMQGWLMVTDEVAAVTGPDGRFTLRGVPPGTHRLRVWHETLGETDVSITVKAGETATVRVPVDGPR